MGEAFYERLKKLRKEANLTQGELSEILLVHIQTVSRWERGLIEPDISQLGELAVALHVSLEKLLGANEPEVSYTGTFDAVGLGKAIQCKRQKANESQKDLGDFLSVSSDTVSRWERGITCPSIEELIKLSERYNSPISEIYYGFSEEKTTTVEPVVYAKTRRKPWLIATTVLSVICVVMSIGFIVLLNLNIGRGITHTVTVDGVSYEVDENSSYTPTPSVKEGYEFMRWEDQDGNVIKFPQIIDANKIYYAVYAPKEYTIDYWLNGGSFLSSQKNTLNIEDKSVSLPTPEKAGSVFAGWYFSPDYEGEAVSEISCECKDVTVYAKWDNVVYSVRYELNGGSCSQQNVSTVTAEKEEVLNNPVKKGYLFVGWFDAEKDGELHTTVGGKNAKNLVLYAKWQKSDKYFEISYDLDGGSLAVENPSKIAAGDIATLQSPQKHGYTFLGWNDKADGSGKYYETLYGIYENLTLYAVYSPKTYLIKYEYDGVYETEKSNPNIITYGDTVELLPLYKYGYDFLGWFTEKSKTARKIERVNTENVDTIDTLYAVFDVKIYTITLDLLDGVIDEEDAKTGETIDGKYVYKTTIESPTFYLPSCKKDGYIFLGWYKGDKLVEKIGAENMTVSELSAKWERDDRTYTITYDLQSESAFNDNPVTFLCREKLVLNQPTLDGYEFLGWYDNSDGFGQRVTFIAANNYSDVKLFAVWQKIVISGDYENFTFDNYGDYVKITGYAGESGENVRLVVPAKINGLPVVEVSKLGAPFYSVTLPEGVVTVGENFLNGKLVQPFKIPATVKTIAKNAFNYFNGEITFADNSLLERIEDKAFYSAYIANLLKLPNSVKYIGTEAFSEGQEVVMSDGIEYITEGFKATVFFSENAVNSLKTALNLKTTLYMPWSVSSTDKIESEWRIPVSQTLVTLVDGEFSSTLNGYWFSLPERNKTGYFFVGWEGENGLIISHNLYIPNCEAVTLYARYVKYSDADGLTAANAKPLKINDGSTFNVYLKNTPKQSIDFFFTIDSDTSGTAIFKISNFSNFPLIVAYIDEYGIFKKVSGAVEFKKGMVFCVAVSDSDYFTELKRNSFYSVNLILEITTI